MKPSNVLLDRDGHARLADLGIARLLPAGGMTMVEPAGSPAYLAREQVAARISSVDVDAPAAEDVAPSRPCR